MNLKYQIRKSFYGFLQKYDIRSHTRIGLRLLFVFLIIWIFASFATIISQWGYSDHFEGTPFQAKYLRYFWPVIIELVSGYEIDGAEFGLNPISDVLSILVVITGIIIIAIFTAQIVSIFIRMVERINFLPEKPQSFTFKRPVIICGNNDKLHNIIVNLRKSCLIKGREIVVIGESADQIEILDKKIYKNVWHIKGDRADRSLIDSAMGEEETSAIILAAKSADAAQGRYADSRAIETAMAIEGCREQAHTVVELLDERNIPHLKQTRIDEWISIFDYGIKLVAQSALQHEMGNVYRFLFGNTEEKDTSQFFFSREKLPHRFVGRSFKEVRKIFMTNSDIDATLIGFARHVDPEMSTRPHLQLKHLPFIKQLNPISRKCRICGSEELESDELGRIKRTCIPCFNKIKTTNKNITNRWFYPNDTCLKHDDILIYLSNHYIKLKDVFD